MGKGPADEGALHEEQEEGCQREIVTAVGIIACADVALVIVAAVVAGGGYGDVCY